MKIEHKSSNNKYLSLDNNSQFLIDSHHQEEIKKWNVGDKIKVKKHNSDNPYSYEIYNELTDTTVCAVRTI